MRPPRRWRRDIAAASAKAKADVDRQIAAAIATLDAAKAESAKEVESKATELSNQIIKKVVECKRARHGHRSRGDATTCPRRGGFPPRGECDARFIRTSLGFWEKTGCLFGEEVPGRLYSEGRRCARKEATEPPRRERTAAV